ncbi:hypothetical protein [Caulobacter hibisci]|uniref:Uncharacterized protein n=1 Tax=Caulobacter hibisci TaxID=2035993 RepID=A0ABS0T5B9_9CAUL|nr:hypothetical protein [Caulobacter hibisci]MBI1687054.1 hypothetical protein [Caulobacter hibisci]
MPIRPSPLVEFLKFCSLATAAIFGLSALINGFLFWAAWRLNFYVIAGPTDVVMGGFAIFWQVACAFALAYIGMGLFRWMLEQLCRRWQTESPRRQTFAERMAEIEQDRRINFCITMLVALATSFFYLIWGSAGISKSGWRLLNHRSPPPQVYTTGLRVAAESAIDERCHGGDVLWLGSASAILDCQQGVRVFHNIDDLVTEPSTEVPLDAQD